MIHYADGPGAHVQICAGGSVLNRAAISIFILILLVAAILALNPHTANGVLDTWHVFGPWVLAWRDRFVEMIFTLPGVRRDAPTVPQPLEPELQLKLIITLSRSVRPI